MNCLIETEATQWEENRPYTSWLLLLLMQLGAFAEAVNAHDDYKCRNAAIRLAGIAVAMAEQADRGADGFE